MKYLGIIVAFALTAFSAAAQGQTAATTPVQPVSMQLTNDDRYRVGFQDILQVNVFKHPELAQRVAVGTTGLVTLFRLDKPVIAGCKTEQELADAIAAAYKANFVKDPQVQVAVTEQKSQSIGV